MFNIYDFLGADECLSIVDVGAIPMGDAKEIYQPLLADGRSRITGFDPDEAACAELNQANAGNGTFLPYLIGDGGPGVFHETALGLASSLLEPNDNVNNLFYSLENQVKTVKTENVQTHRLDDIAEIEDIDLLKMDVQGGEIDVMQGAERLMRGVMLVYTEVNFVEMYKDQPLFADVDTYLRDKGFMFHRFMDFGSRCFKPMLMNNRPNDGLSQYIWSDAVFFASPAQFRQYPIEKLLKLAIILHELFRSYDVVLMIWAHVSERAGRAYANEYVGRINAELTNGTLEQPRHKQT